MRIEASISNVDWEAPLIEVHWREFVAAKGKLFGINESTGEAWAEISRELIGATLSVGLDHINACRAQWSQEGRQGMLLETEGLLTDWERALGLVQGERGYHTTSLLRVIAGMSSWAQETAEQRLRDQCLSIPPYGKDEEKEALQKGYHKLYRARKERIRQVVDFVRLNAGEWVNQRPGEIKIDRAVPKQDLV